MTGRAGWAGPLAERPFRLLWIGQTASAAGDALIFVAVAFAVLHVGGTAADMGIVFAAFTVSNVALVLAGGVWADRLPRQLVMVGCDIVRGAAEVVLAILLLTGEARVWHIAVGAVAIGGAGAFFQPASMGLIPQTVSAGRLQQANALMSLSRNGSRIFGPPLAGLLIALSSTGVVFLVDAVTFAISAVSLLMLRVPPSPPREAAPESFIGELVGGWREVTARPWIVASICTFAISNMAAAPFLILGPVVAEEHLGGAAAWGLILTGGGIGGVIGGILALRVRPDRPLLAAFLIMAAISLPPLALVGPLPVLLIAASSLLSLLAIELANTWWYTMLQQHVPDHARSRVSSYDWLVSLVFQPLGFLLAGPLAAGIGLGATLIGAAVLGLAANYGVLLVRSVREVRWVEEPAA